MFVQATRCKRGSSTYFIYLVRESFRTPQGPRSRTICNITALPEVTLDLVAQSLLVQSFVATAKLELTDAWSFGGLAVLRQSWHALALDRILSSIRSVRNVGLLKAMIFGRILFPSAKLALVAHARGALLAAACGLNQAREDVDENDLYAAMVGLSGKSVGREE